MITNGILPPTVESADGSSLALLRLPYTFTQDPLLTSEGFVAEAAKMSLSTSLEELENLRFLGLLVPLFRIDDEHSDPHVVDISPSERTDLAMYARLGQVRDPSKDLDPAAYPIEQARRTDAGRLWDGYYFSPWQLLALRYAQNDLQWHTHGEPLAPFREHANKWRKETIVLSALAPRHLSAIWGQVSLPGGGDFTAFAHARYDIADKTRIDLAGVPPSELLGPAEFLLTSAHSKDPMIEWWPLIRHSNHSGWGKLSGISLYCLWQRIAAEILLRAHVHLAEAKLVEPLPNETEGHFWKPLYDRISAREASGLEEALGALGLSPHPRVMLIVEGETELMHVSRLLEEFDMASPNRVRLLNIQGSQKNPRDLARYVVTPRLGQIKFGRQYLAATPTALYIAMDPENRWKDAKSRALERTKIQLAIRDEVTAQGATISQDELDMLVHVFVWGENSYELANFTDEQIIAALTPMAVNHKVPGAGSTQWVTDVHRQLKKVRQDSHGIEVALGRLHIPVEKVKLAERLLPVLLAQLSLETGQLSPVVEMVRQVSDLVQRLSGSGYRLSGEATAAAEVLA